MKSSRIVFIPVIAVIAGFSAFLAVLLICLDLVPAIAGEREGVAKEKEKSRAIEERAVGEAQEIGRDAGDFGARAEKSEESKREVRPETKQRPPAPPALTERNAPPDDRKQQFLKEREEIEALRRAGKLDAAEHAERGLRERANVHGLEAGEPAEHHRGPAPDPSMGERVGHLMEAAEHLQLAGFQDEAAQWRERAEDMKRRIHAEAGGERVENLVHRVEELQDAMGRMREEMQRLHEKLGERQRGRD